MIMIKYIKWDLDANGTWMLTGPGCWMEPGQNTRSQIKSAPPQYYQNYNTSILVVLYSMYIYCYIVLILNPPPLRREFMMRNTILYFSVWCVVTVKVSCCYEVEISYTIIMCMQPMYATTIQHWISILMYT